MIIFKSEKRDADDNLVYKLELDAPDALATEYGITETYECSTPFSLGFTKDQTLLSPFAYYSGSIRLQFTDDSQVNLIRLLNAFDYKDIKVYIVSDLSGGTTKTWIGYLEPFLSGGNVDHTPQEIVLNYVDGVGRLVDEDFRFTDKPVWHATSSLIGGNYMSIFNVFLFGLRSGGIDIQKIYYKGGITLNKDFLNKDSGTNTLESLCVPRRFLMEVDGPKKTLGIFEEILNGLGLNAFVYGMDLILYPKVDYYPQDPFFVATATARSPGGNAYYIDVGGQQFQLQSPSIFKENWLTNRFTEIKFNSESSAMSYIDKGDVFTARRAERLDINDSFKGDKDYITTTRLGSTDVETINTYGSVVGGFTTSFVDEDKKVKPNLHAFKLDGAILREKDGAGALINETYQRHYRIKIPDALKTYSEYDSMALTFNVNGQLGYIKRDISVLGKEFPFVLLRFTLTLNSKTVTKFAAAATNNEREQSSSVIFDLKDFGSPTGIQTASLFVTLCPTLPSAPYFYSDEDTNKLMLQHRETQIPLVESFAERSNGFHYGNLSTTFPRTPKNRIDFKLERRNLEIEPISFQDTEEGKKRDLITPSLLFVRTPDTASSLGGWSESIGWYDLLQNMSLMDASHPDTIYDAGFKRRLNILGTNANDPNPIQLVSNGLKFKFAPKYLRDKYTYEIGTNTDEEDGITFTRVLDDGTNQGTITLGSEIPERDSTIRDTYYRQLDPISSGIYKPSIISLTSVSRTTETPQELDIDILDSFINPENEIKIGYLGVKDFAAPKDFHGSVFIAIEVEPIVNELSLTWKAYSQSVLNRRYDVGQLVLFGRELYNYGLRTYSGFEDSVGYSVRDANINQNASIKFHYISVNHGEHRILGTHEIPIAAIRHDSTRNLDLAANYLRDSQYGSEAFRQSQVPFIIARAQTLRRGNDTNLLPSYFLIRDLRHWLNDTDITLPRKLAREIIKDRKVSEFYYILKDITVDTTDVLYLVKEEGNSLPTQISEWEGIDEEYGDEDKSLYNYSLNQGTLFDPWAKIKDGEQMPPMFPLNYLRTSNFYTWYVTEDQDDLIKNAEIEDRFYTYHEEAYKYHKTSTEYSTFTEALHAMFSDYHSEKRLLLEGEAVDEERDKVITPLHYAHFKWTGRIDESRLMQVINYINIFNSSERRPIVCLENIRANDSHGAFDSSYTSSFD